MCAPPTQVYFCLQSWAAYWRHKWFLARSYPPKLQGTPGDRGWQKLGNPGEVSHHLPAFSA